MLVGCVKLLRSSCRKEALIDGRGHFDVEFSVNSGPLKFPALYKSKNGKRITTTTTRRRRWEDEREETEEGENIGDEWQRDR